MDWEANDQLNNYWALYKFLQAHTSLGHFQKTLGDPKYLIHGITITCLISIKYYSSVSLFLHDRGNKLLILTKSKLE